MPPSTPLLLSTGSSQHALQLQWKLGDDGGSPVRGFALHYKAEHGEWDERRVDGKPNNLRKLMISVLKIKRSFRFVAQSELYYGRISL